jgi:biuret amidohydrolase
MKSNNTAPGRSALVVVDMQRYYLDSASSYHRYFSSLYPGCMDYLLNRARDIVVPNIQKLIRFFENSSQNIIYLLLCGEADDRVDLHHAFRETWDKGRESGYDNIYPLRSDPWSSVIDPLAPPPGSSLVYKTTYSAFTSSPIHSLLKDLGITTLVFTGLATSQCVETTARDASDHNYEVILIEDALADYDEFSHSISLYNSQAVCGGIIFETDEYIRYLER